LEQKDKSPTPGVIRFSRLCFCVLTDSLVHQSSRLQMLRRAAAALARRSAAASRPLSATADAVGVDAAASVPESLQPQRPSPPSPPRGPVPPSESGFPYITDLTGTGPDPSYFRNAHLSGAAGCANPVPPC